MGNVFFDTDVNKTVDIDKIVNLTVNKDVFSFVDLTGNLATAEASADAIGSGGGGGPGGPPVIVNRDFLIDDFSDLQQLTVDTVAGETSSQGFAPNIFAGTTPNPNGITFDETQIPFGIREVNLFDELGVGTSEIVIGGPPGNSSIQVSTPTEGASNNFFTYTSGAPQDPGGDPFSILVECPQPGFDPEDCEIDFSDIQNNNIVFEDANFAAEEGTLRFEALIEDSDGTTVTRGAYAMSVAEGAIQGRDAFPLDGQDLVVPLAFFVDPGGVGEPPIDAELEFVYDPDGPVGPQVVNDGFYNAGFAFEAGADEILDLDNVVRIELRLLGTPIGAANGPDSDIAVTAGENTDTTAFDVSFDLVDINSQCVCDPGGDGGGNLAETDTFAQVTEDGAFSFSESLAAFDPFEIA